MEFFLSSISSVTGPLSLLAFLAVVFLAIFRRSINDKKGLKYVYDLFNDRLTKDQFYDITKQIIDRLFWLLIIIFLLSILAYIIPTVFAKDSSPLIPNTNESDKVNETPISESTFLYMVRVQEKETVDIIPNAEVTMDVAGRLPFTAITNDEGLVAFEVESIYAGNLGTLHVNATGYEKYSLHINVFEGELPTDIRLVSISDQ
ncbi:MAG: hypothetical protein GY797_34590 [Deltaproteobacteria bacterium]|nr:hypothetical protein [Deltaproteobacteria bacterium]